MNSLLYNAFKNGVLMFLVVSMSILNIPASSTAEVDEQTKPVPPVLEPAKSKNVILNPIPDGSSTPGKTKIEPDQKTQKQADEVADKQNDEIIQSQGSNISADKEKIITEPTAEDDEQTQHAPPVIEPAKSKDIILNPTPGKTKIEPDQKTQKQTDDVTEKQNNEVTQSPSSNISAKKEKIETELPKEITETTTDGMTMLYIGGAIAGVAILAGALAANSGSSDSSSVPVEPAIPVVGPDLGGNDWLGFLDIKDKNHKGYQAISARIIHNGDAVQITTSSNLDYGKQLNGTISKGGFMLMYDSVTGEAWTTHFDNATSKRIDLYDYVNHLNDLDRMKLSR